MLGELVTETERLAGAGDEERDVSGDYSRYVLPREDRRGAVQHEGFLPVSLPESIVFVLSVCFSVYMLNINIS